MNYEALKAEALDDPLGRGYGAMTDADASTRINLVDRPRNRTTMSGDEVFQSVESLAVWNGLTADQRGEFLSFCARDSIDPFGTMNVSLVVSIFGPGSPTVANLQSARVELVSRPVELNMLGASVEVGPAHIAIARAS